MTTAFPTPKVPQNFDTFGPWFEKTFRLFAARWQVWVLQGLIALSIYLGVFVIFASGFFALFASVIGADALFSAIREKQQIDPFLHATPALIAAFVSLCLLLLVVAVAVQVMIQVGMTSTALKQARGEEIVVSDLFSGGRAHGKLFSLIGKLLIASLIVFFFSCLALLACIVPAFFVWPFFYFIVPILVDQPQRSASESIRLSYDTCKQNYWLFFVYGLVFNLLVTGVNSVLGNIPFVNVVVGIAAMLVMLPIQALAAAIPYVDIFDGEIGQQGPMTAAGPQPYLPPAYTPPSDTGPTPPPTA